MFYPPNPLFWGVGVSLSTSECPCTSVFKSLAHYFDSLPLACSTESSDCDLSFLRLCPLYSFSCPPLYGLLEKGQKGTRVGLSTLPRGKTENRLVGEAAAEMDIGKFRVRWRGYLSLFPFSKRQESWCAWQVTRPRREWSIWDPLYWQFQPRDRWELQPASRSARLWWKRPGLTCDSRTEGLEK